MNRSIALVLLLAGLPACGDGGEAEAEQQAAVDRAAADSAFEELQERGASAEAMGVDQYTSTHVFEDLADGDFAIPGFVHNTDQAPGTAVMAERRNAIDYEFAELPRGGEVRIRTGDSRAVRAIHEFLAFQRSDHRTTGNHPTH